MKQVEVNHAASIYLLADSCYKGARGVQQDHAKAMKLYARSGELGFSKAHYYLGLHYYSNGGDLKKAKFHYEAAAIAGHEVARHNLGIMEAQYRSIE
jgi:TPR repeat protein